MDSPLQVAEESSFTDRMDRWVEQVLGPDYRRFCARRTWTPSVNLYENAKGYYLVVELAGVEADKIDFRVENNTVILEGRRLTPRPQACQASTCENVPATHLRTHLMEIDHGPFCRTLQLPEPVDREKVEAAYRNGYLWVTLPKVK